MNAPIVLTPGTLPAGYCPVSHQDLYNMMFALASASLTLNVSYFIFSKTEPDITDRDKVWVKRNDDGGDGSLNRMYAFWDGKWVSPYPTPYSSKERRMWVGTPTELLTYDEGNTLVVGEEATTGPFWEIDTDFAGKFPIGPGTLDLGTVVAVGGVGGSEKHTLIEAELPATVTGTITTNDFTDTSPVGMSLRLLSDVSGSGTTVDVAPAISNFGANTPHNNLPPYRGVHIIKRTSRKFYTGV